MIHTRRSSCVSQLCYPSLDCPWQVRKQSGDCLTVFLKIVRLLSHHLMDGCCYLQTKTQPWPFITLSAMAIVKTFLIFHHKLENQKLNMRNPIQKENFNQLNLVSGVREVCHLPAGSSSLRRSAGSRGILHYSLCGHL